MKYCNFNELDDYNTLIKLAENPVDLSDNSVLTVDRLERYHLQNGSFELLYGTQRITDQVLDTLQNLADQAELVAQFLAMKRGAVMNRIIGQESENRQVLHTACRDVFADTRQHPEASAQARQQLDRLRRFLDELDRGELTNARGERFTTMVQVGIGGSDLGPRALYTALKRYCQPDRRAMFIANVDPDDAAAVLAELDLSRTLFNVVSKSGITLETRTNELLVRQALEAKGLDPLRHILAVTGEGSPMDDRSRYLESFYMYDYIGGRFSATSMVGGVTLGFALGFEAFEALLHGAHEIDVAAEAPDIRKNLPLLMALLGIWNHNFLGCATTAILPYSQPLSRFPAHLQQCDMESNGKSVSRSGLPVTWQTGPIVWGEPGTNGQHAFYQLLHQGTAVVPVEFIAFRKSQYATDIEVEGSSSQQKLVANVLAQSLALAMGQENDNLNQRFEGNRPSLLLMADRLTPQTMGELLAIYEARIVFQGFCWNINSFDQEGVQLGKTLATRLQELMVHPDADTGKNLERGLLRITGMQ